MTFTLRQRPICDCNQWKKGQPGGKGSPSSPGSWVWRGRGKPSQKSQSWCSHSWGSSQPSCTGILLGTFYQQTVSVGPWPPNKTLILKREHVFGISHVSVDISYPASELFPQSRASALPSRKYWFSGTRRKKRSNFPEDTFSPNQPTVGIPAFSIYSVKLKVLFEYSVSLSPVVSLNTVLLKSSNAVSFVAMGHRMHLCRRFPINSWRPTRAKTDRAKTVRIMTSTIFFTDWIKAATMVFKPRKNRWLKQGWTHSLR